MDPSRETRFAVIALLFASFATQVALAQVKQPEYPEVVCVFPPGGQRGKEVSITIAGRNLVEPKQLLVSGKGITVASIESSSPRTVTARLRVDADAEIGKRLVRVLTSHGLSDGRWFVVGDLPETVEEARRDTPQSIQPPTVVNGRIGPREDVDHFRFTARRGERVLIAVDAHSIDSLLSELQFADMIVSVLDADGRELAEGADFNGFDPLLVFEAPRDGDYLIRIRENSYNGADDAVYRITVGAVPYVTSIFPPGGKRGESTLVELHGFNLPARPNATIPIPSDAPLGPQTISLSIQPANPVAFFVTDGASLVEKEPNNTVEQATAASLPADYFGRLNATDDSDCYAVSLQKGQSMIAEVFAERHFRSPVDTVIELLDSKQRVIASNDDGTLWQVPTNNRLSNLHGDSWLEFTPPADGRYVVRLKDIAGRGGPDCVYRLSIRPQAPGFALYVFPDNPQIIGPGGSGGFGVSIRRWGGFAEPVELSVAGLPAGFRASAGYLPPSATFLQIHHVWMTVSCDPAAPVGTMAPFRVIGRAKLAGKPVEVVAEPLCHFCGISDAMLLRPSESAIATVAVADEFYVECPLAELVVKPGQRGKIPVTIRRVPPYAGPGYATVIVPRPGPEIDFSPVVIAPSRTEGAIEYSVAANAADGEHTVVVARPQYGDIRVSRPGPAAPALRLRVEH